MLSIMPTSPGHYSSAGSSSSPTLSAEEARRHVITTEPLFYKKRKSADNKEDATTKLQRLDATYADDFESETDVECEDDDDDEDRKSKVESDNRTEDGDDRDVAFTILQDDDLEVEDTNVDVGDEGIGSTEELCVNHARKAKRASSGIFEVDSSPESHGSDSKVLSPANSSLLQAKLMALTQAQDNNNDQEDLAYTKKLIKSHEYLQKIHKLPDSLQDDHLFKKNIQQKINKQFDRINNLSREKVLSQSNGNLHHQKTFILKKDYSQSYNNIEKRSDYSRYHQNCYVPGKMSTRSPVELKVNRTRGKRSVGDPPTFNITTHNNNNKNIYNNNNNKQQQYDNTRSLNNGLKNNNNNKSRLVVNNNNNNNSSSCNKPVFVTTVKKGEFLEPPPEVAYLLGYGLSSSNSANGSNNSLNSGIRDRHQQQALFYSFSSQPRVLNQTRSREKTPNKINNNSNSNLNNNNSNNNNNLNNGVKISSHQRSKRSTKGDDEESNVTYGNLMYDRRVVRGSTIAQGSAAPWNPYFGYAKLLSQPQTNEDIVTSRQREARRRAIARRRAQGAQSRANQWKGSSPPPVSGRRHEVVQTDKFLEELFLNPPETEVACQTELFVEPPETPPFVAAPQGVDAETQVYPGELFDWDAEVTSLMEVLVGKNIQDALAEVLEEEELAVLQDQQRQMAELRAVHLLREEQQAERSDRDNDAAAILTKRYLAETLPSVLDGLREAGYVLDDVKVDGEEGLMPWLMLEVSSEMNHMVNSKDILTDIVREILETRAEIYRVMSEEEGKELDLEDSEGEGDGEGNRKLPELET